jgi:Xaa-Pro aminopeptidase
MEGAAISCVKSADQTDLREGMMIAIGTSARKSLANSEPGVYLPSILGMRLENVYVITMSSVPQYTFLHPTLVRPRKFLSFETLDYIPFQRKMVMEELLTTQEWERLRLYHSQCVERISGQCYTKLGREWLEREAGKWLH